MPVYKKYNPVSKLYFHNMSRCCLYRLRYLNMTRNRLCDIPVPNLNDSFNKLQELYLSFNNLGNSAVTKVCCFPRLRVLHLAGNKISVIEERFEQLIYFVFCCFRYFVFGVVFTCFL